MAKLLAESLGETKKGEWSTFIVGWDYMIAGGRTGTTSNAHYFGGGQPKGFINGLLGAHRFACVTAGVT